MANYNFTVPSLGNKYIDFRTEIIGDSYNWSWIRPMSQVTSIAIHHTAGPDNQTPQQIAGYHVNTLGWGGVGYHFIITPDGTVYYVGDLNTARAHVKDRNESSIGICLVGSFMNGKTPKDAQIASAHVVCSRLLFESPELPNLNGWEDISGHKELGNATACPGDSWAQWKQKLIIGIPQTPPVADEGQRIIEITKLYQVIFGRTPDQEGLNSYVKSRYTIDEIRKILTESIEHRQILERAQTYKKFFALATEARDHLAIAVQKVDEISQSASL
ncbi:MAG: N-acetylmuramoyl-L-alanine amidase [bacterium]|nr:N-acetylmuramoyl-L-alanine amidase [bacterium]